jgi:D-serine deaminase-like pyridoxal phosphate-dependent protein
MTSDAVADEASVLTELAAMTPCLLLDLQRMDRNIARLRTRLERLGVTLNPHFKTPKSIAVLRRLMGSAAEPCTVSTLQEAEYLAAAGLRQILYAVGITPAKLPRVAALRRRGVDITVVLDSVEQAYAMAALARQTGDSIPALIELDTDGHRCGARPDDAPLLLRIAHALRAGGLEVRGVMAHAGESYNRTGEGLAAMAEQERAGAVHAASMLREHGFACPTVSVGSTPTAHAARDLRGVTEMRAGVFVFFDLVMAGIGVCAVEDIALSVLTTVIGHQPERGWIMIDAGWMALSRDRGTAKQAVDQGYGMVCDIDGRPYPDLIVIETNQEHGIAAVRPGSNADVPSLPIGTLLRILPNHACATAAQHDRYHVLEGQPARVTHVWERIRGW